MKYLQLSIGQNGLSRAAIFVVLAYLPGPCVRETTAQQPLRSAIKEGEVKHASDVKDTAGLFDARTMKEAREELYRIERTTHVSTVIQTVESLRGQKVSDVAIRLARQTEIQGIFVLIAKSEREIELLVSKKYRPVLTTDKQAAIRAAFIESFKKGHFDEGLARGVAAISDRLAAARSEPAATSANAIAAMLAATPTAPGSAPGGSPLLIRDRIRLGLAGARTIIVGAKVKATELKLTVNIATVDDGGHLVAFERMDGARPASLYTAITKATSAATFRQPTGPLAAGSTPPDPILNISLQNAASASGGKVTALVGGVPVVVDGQIIGAVGIAGGTGEQDAQVARAGIQELLDQLAKTEAAATAAKPVEKPE